MQTTGKIGDLIVISGSGIYDISAVRFGSGNTGASGDFSLYPSQNYLTVTVPEFAAWDYVQLISNARGITGNSTFKFVPEPKISKLTPVSGLPGDVIIIEGRSFSGVTGVEFNNLTGAFTVNTLTGITATVPTGNTKGFIRVLGQSGLSFLSDIDFIPWASVTGLSAYQAKTGDTINILGTNFIADIMYDTNSPDGDYLISFNGASGTATRTNITTLQAIVPNFATSGPVRVHRDTVFVYESSGANLTILLDPPKVNVLIPYSGKTGDFLIINGLNFVGITGILLSGNGIKTQIQDSDTVISSVGDTLYVKIPNLIEGNKTLIISGTGGVYTGNSVFRVIDTPTYSGVTAPSGISGDIIRITGKNLYPFSDVYFNSSGYAPLTHYTGGTIDWANNAYIDVYVPSHARELLNDIIVDNSVGVSSGTNQFTLIPKPFISGFTPNPVRWGASVLITGSGFHFITGFRFNATGYSYTTEGVTGLRFTVKTGAIDGNAEIFTTGSYATTKTIGVLPDPVIITGFIPSKAVRGDAILITGAYMNTVTSVGFSGDAGEQTVTKITYYGTTGIGVNVPYTAKTGAFIVYNRYSGVRSATLLNLYEIPIITGFTPVSGIYQKTITLSGQYFTSGEFYFRGVTGNLIKGTNTSITSDILATTRVPREIVQWGIYASGVGAVSSRQLSGTDLKFTPLPTISGMNYGTLDTVYPDNIITISGINAYEGSGAIFISGADILCARYIADSVIVDKTQFLTNGLGLTVFSGLINANYLGEGRFFLASKYHPWVTGQMLDENITAPDDVTLITVNDLAPLFSGYVNNTGGHETPIDVTGNHLRYVTGILFRNVSAWDTEATGGVITATGNKIITIRPPSGFTEGNCRVTLISAEGTVSGTDFTYVLPPHITGFGPVEIFTGYYIAISGTNLTYITGFQLINGFGDIVSSTFVNNNSGASISGLIPADRALSDADLTLRVLNYVSSGQTGTAKITNERDRREKEENEISIFLGPPPFDF